MTNDYYHPVTEEELALVTDLLTGTDTSLEVALSEIGIDPDESDLKYIRGRLPLKQNQDTGLWHEI